MRFRQSLFWDVDPKTINAKRHARYIIERIMNFGNNDEVRWMQKTFSRRILRDVVRRSRVLNAMTRNFWQLALFKENEVIRFPYWRDPVSKPPEGHSACPRCCGTGVILKQK